MRQAPHLGHGEQVGRKRVAPHQRAIVVARARGLNDGPIHRIECLRRAGEGGPAQQLCPLRSRGRHAFGDRHLVPGEGAGLVGAQHRRRAEDLDGRGTPGQDVPARDPPGAHRHEDREDQGKLLRQHRHAQRDAGERSVEPGTARQAIDHGCRDARGNGRECEQPHQLPGLERQARSRRIDRGERSADPTHFSRGSGRVTTAPTAHHERPRIESRCVLRARALDIRGFGMTGAFGHATDSPVSIDSSTGAARLSSTPSAGTRSPPPPRRCRRARPPDPESAGAGRRGSPRARGLAMARKA